MSSLFSSENANKAEKDFSIQINDDQKKFSRYVCDSRAIPNLIDGLKPVQRRILWTMWHSSAKENFTKTVKIAGMVMAYHPHGNTSIEDAISQMVQSFTFANNYPLIAGEGTFGDILDPKAIASPRYTEVKLSNFAKDVGIFESIADINYINNYDETAKEPIFFVPKIPLVFLNPILGIATGFRANLLGHRLSDVVDKMILFLKNPAIAESALELSPWYKGIDHKSFFYEYNENKKRLFHTGFAFKRIHNKIFLTQAPQNWNREKVVIFLENLIKNNNEIKDYLDHSRESFQIEIVFKRGFKATPLKLKKFFSKTNIETIEQYVINDEGKLVNYNDKEIIERFCQYRKKHLIIRFNRLAEIENQKISKLNELIRFIKEEWNQKLTGIKNKEKLEAALKKKKFIHYRWLVEIPLYRLTKEEVDKNKKFIQKSKALYLRYNELAQGKKKLTDYMIDEINELKKWDQK